MALETLKGIKEIDGFKVNEHYNTLTNNQWSLIPEEDKYIDVNYERNSISFKIQNGPIRENGVNGCQVVTLIKTAKIMLEGLNKNYRSWENMKVISELNTAIAILEQRRLDR